MSSNNEIIMNIIDIQNDFFTSDNPKALLDYPMYLNILRLNNKLLKAYVLDLIKLKIIRK